MCCSIVAHASIRKGRRGTVLLRKGDGSIHLSAGELAVPDTDRFAVSGHQASQGLGLAARRTLNGRHLLHRQGPTV